MGWTIMRMQDQLPAWKILCATLEGKMARRGGPKLRWEDSVIQDVRRLGKRNGRHVGQNREDLQNLLRKAMAHRGLLSQ